MDVLVNAYLSAIKYGQSLTYGVLGSLNTSNIMMSHDFGPSHPIRENAALLDHYSCLWTGSPVIMCSYAQHCE